MQDDDLLVNVTEVDGAKVLPPCVILNRLGVGGMGAVYKAFHLNLKCDVAVKVLKPQLVADDPSLVERFEREGRAAARINHPNVIGVKDICEHSGLHYIIMEFVDGENGRARVKRKGALPVGEALQIVYEAAMGLDAAHRIGIIHRDIKPDNLMISKEGVKVADLGLAKATLGGGGNSMLSMPNTVMGTAAYMPPEQWESSSTTATDVWALGATLYYFLAGRDAFSDPESNYLRIMKKIVMQPFPDIRALVADLPEDVVALLGKMTAKEIPDRFQDAEQVHEAIAQLTTKRTPLRSKTKVAPAPEAPTIVTPGPAFNIEKIKDWMREDANTRIERQPTPPRGNRTQPKRMPAPPPEPDVEAEAERAPETEAQPRPITDRPSRAPKPAPPPKPKPVPEPEPVEAEQKGGTAIQPEPTPQIRWGIVAAAVLTLCGGIGFAVKSIWFGGDPVVAPGPGPRPSDPFVRVDELEQQNEFGTAIAEMTRLFGNDANLKTEARVGQLVRLYSRDAKRLAEAKSWKSALEQLQLALAVKDDPTVRQQQQDLRTAIRGVAKSAVKGVRPEATEQVQKNAVIECAVTCDLDAVTALELAGVPAKKENNQFAASINTGDAAEIKIGVILVDGDKFYLDPWKLTYVAEAPKALTFSKKPKATRFTDTTETLALTDQATIEVTGILNQPGAELFQGTEKVGETRTDGSFTVRLKVTEEAKRLPLTVTAKKRQFTDYSESLEVVRLTKGPPCEVKPVPAATTKDADVTLTVDADEWTTTVEYRVNKAPWQKLTRPATGVTWTRKVPLIIGKNDIDVRAFNLADKEGSAKPLTITREPVPVTPPPIQPATLTAISLLGKDDALQALDSSPRYITDAEAKLRIECGGTRPQLTVGNDTIPLVDGRADVALKKYLKQEERVSLQIVAKNEKDTATRTLELTLDTMMPTVVIDTPGPVAEGALLTISATCTDRSRIARVQVTEPGGKPKDARLEAGKWIVRFDPPQKARTLTVIAFDSAGNQSAPTPVAVKLAPSGGGGGDVNKPVAELNPQLVSDGFELAANAKPNGGWPDRIVNKEKKIVFVAVGAVANGKPEFYAAEGMVTNAQYDSGDDSILTGVRGRDGPAFAARLGKRFGMLTPAEFEALAKVPGARDTGTGSPGEWLGPVEGSIDDFYVAKDERKVVNFRKGIGYGFRVVYRP